MTECWFGASKNIFNRRSLCSVIRSALSDAQFDDSATLDTSGIDSWEHVVALTGIPALHAQRRGDPIATLCRGVAGSDWIYVVHASPVEPVETIRMINLRATEIRDIYANYMLKNSSIDDRDRIAQRLVKLLEADQKRYECGRQLGMWDINTLFAADENECLERGRGLLYGVFSSSANNSIPIRVHKCRNGASTQPKIDQLHSAEAAMLAHPPSEDLSGFEVVEQTRFGLETPVPARMQVPIFVGEVQDRGAGTGNQFYVDTRELTKHALIAGVTGSGKTNTCFNLLEQIWDQGRGIPFLVIESAKSEYRALLGDGRFKGLRIFTIGDETVSPIRINPFEVSPGTLVQTHIDYLKSLFSAAFVLYPPMPYVLEQSIQEVYEDRGWDIGYNTNRRGDESPRRFPTLDDLAAKIPVVIDRMGYDAQLTMDVTAGLLARINQLRIGGGKGSMLDQAHSLPASVLFEEPCVLELKQIVSDDEKAFIIGLIMIRLYEYRESKPQTGKPGLRHLMLIEEAHRLLRNTSTDQSSEVSANPRGRAIEVFSNILSEIRAFGEGIVIAEQVPTKLTPDAIKNSNLKILHRLVAEDDRKIIGASINLDDTQKRRMATLTVGEAVVYVEGLRKPVLVSVPLSSRKDHDTRVSDEEVRQHMESFRVNHAELFLRHPGCAGCSSGRIGTAGCMDRRVDTDDLILGAFRKLINAMRLSKPLVLDAYADFEGIVLRTDRGKGYETLPYCTFVHLVEADIERRGEFASWAYSDVSELIRLGCSVIRTLSAELGRSSRKAVESTIMKELAAFANLYRRLCRVDRLPYVGCDACVEQCHYRFDMCYRASSVEARDFQ
ncbi:MAG: ATP-binding protein, partial [Woeseiaceae bacterium]|nr:ATP-binding protein [Woeseiaceae bacterium]